jgi:hypothetical protein
MAPIKAERLTEGGSSSDDVEAPRDSVTSHVAPNGKPELAVQSTFVDTRTGQPVDVEKAYPGVPHDALPEHLEKAHLRERFGVATHGGVKAKHQRAVTVLGRIGWVAKAIVYSLIGGLCCRGGISEDLNVDASPQGVFVLIGKGAAGIYILIIMAAALATYIIWRFWEGITAQGSHPCYSKFKNFFSFRLSPLVSGGVYTAYLAYILVLLPKAFDYHNDAVAKTSGSDFTKSWQSSALGRFGLTMLGLAFLVAAIVMLQGVLTKKFHRELRLKELRPWVKWLVLTAGHVGQLGRFGLFLLVSILMWRALEGKGTSNNQDQNTIGRALSQLQSSHWGQAVLFLIGFGLIVYGLFAVLNSYPAKIFPTPLPSQAEMDKMIKDREEKAAKKEKAKEKSRILTDNRVPTASSLKPGANPAGVAAAV